MSRFDRLPDRAMELANQVGDRVRGALPQDVGDRLRRALPSKAGGLLEAGVALGALKTGGRVASSVIRRNPVIAVAVVAGAGLLWYAARRRAKAARDGAIEGSSRRITQADQGQARRRKAHPDKPAADASTPPTGNSTSDKN